MKYLILVGSEEEVNLKLNTWIKSWLARADNLMASASIENLLEDLSPEELDELSGDIDWETVST